MGLLQKLTSGSRVAGKILLSKATSRRIPLLANILVTNRCNLKCFYCFPQVFERKTHEFTTEELLNLIDEFSKRGTEVVVLLGGEPLLRDDIGVIIDYVKSKNMICEMITNGYLVEKKINDVKKLDSLCVSVDGDEENNDKNRAKGSYKKALEAIRLAKDNNINTRIHAVMTRYTLNSLDHLMELGKKLDVTVNVSQATVHTVHNALNLTDDEIRTLWIKLKEYRKRGYPVGNSESTLDYVIRWPYSYSDIIFKDNNGHKTNPNGFNLLLCKRSKLTCCVDADGRFYPCGVVWDGSGLSVHEVGFQKAWDHLDNTKCIACPVVSEVEMNMLLNLRPSSIWNAFYYLIRDNLRLSSEKTG